ncbi:MAG: chemotaxis protein CheA [Comamonadaceae bacterium]|nr:chemotaxis protein CheA [Comamonadaceae bacterium]
MNALLEQFLSESREALQGIGEKLMQLEDAPEDQELMTQLFRLVHTLKGNSGLFEFPEMTRVLHAGEDLMDAVRNERVHYSQALADHLLDAMDFVGMLCDDIEAERPMPAGLAADAARLARSLRALIISANPADDSKNIADNASAASATGNFHPLPLGEGRGKGAVPHTRALQTNPTALARIPEAIRLAAWQQAQAGSSLYWVYYQPSEECFFQGEDPLHQAKLTPGRLWGGMVARSPWPKLAELDAYRCMLDFDLLAAASRDDIEQHYRYVPDQIQILEVPALALALPQGDPNGGPVYEDFVADALGFLERDDFTGLGRAVRSMLELSNSALWLSSDLRWVSAFLEASPVNLPAVRTLIESLRTLSVPNWSLALTNQVQVAPFSVANQVPDLASAVPAPPTTALAHAPVNLQSQAIADVLAVQREVLALPDDAAWLGGRIKAAQASLLGCLRASGRQAEEATLNTAADAALRANTAAPLAQWLDQAFAPDDGAGPANAATLSTGAFQTNVPEHQPPPLPSPSGGGSKTIGQPVAASAPSGQPTPAKEPAAAEPPELDLRMNRRADDAHNAKTLKVDQVKVDRLMNLIGEMVVAKNAIPYLANRAETVFGVRELSREIKAQYAVINRISEEMQDAIMQVRMMPVSFVFQRFPRLVRDISRKLGKEVNLVLEGQETAADKNIIESLGDPLIHIVRNSLDHGLEMPNVRVALGKPALGTLKIVAKQESDRVVIEISDDGKGIDPAVIKQKAYQKGLIDETTLERITDQEAINLVFAAGFSTAEVVSDLSGRGVGMDVVRTAVERVNGSIVLSSARGQGTTLRLSLPLSMAVTNVMTIASDGQMFGVPMDMVVETVRVPSANVRLIKQRQATVLRGRIVPLLSLNALLGLAAPPLTNDNDELATLVVRVGDDNVGLLVDEFHGTADIILKPLLGVLSSLRAYSGSALMGDGSVLMVINLKELL